MSHPQEVDKEQEGKEGKEETDQGLDVDEDLQNELCKLWDMSMNSVSIVYSFLKL